MSRIGCVSPKFKFWKSFFALSGVQQGGYHLEIEASINYDISVLKHVQFPRKKFCDFNWRINSMNRPSLS